MITCKFEDGGQANLRHVVADTLIIKDNKILLVLRAPQLLNGGKYALIGGYVERDETVVQAAIREAKEETGYDIKIERMLRIKDSPDRHQEDRQNIAFVYIATALEQTGKPDAESTEIKWFDFDNLPSKDMIAFDHFEDILFYLKTIAK